MVEKRTLFYGIALVFVMFVWLVICARELSAFALIKFALIIVFSYIAMLFDIYLRRIPNKLVLIMFAGWLLLILPKIIMDTETGIPMLIDSMLGLLIGGGVFLSVYIISRKGLGGGDVKFMAAAGLYLGLSGTMPTILYGSVLAAFTGIVLILFKKITRKDTMPLAPFLFAGIMITVFTT
jgi:prepilin signal peptidase PulO-like enzyme (type II secretory pathway)